MCRHSLQLNQALSHIHMGNCLSAKVHSEKIAALKDISKSVKDLDYNATMELRAISRDLAQQNSLALHQLQEERKSGGEPRDVSSPFRVLADSINQDHREAQGLHASQQLHLRLAPLGAVPQSYQVGNPIGDMNNNINQNGSQVPPSLVVQVVFEFVTKQQIDIKCENKVKIVSKNIQALMYMINKYTVVKCLNIFIAHSKYPSSFSFR
ncbi:hypothetical protein FGO68_gene14565 [Halteria grandinella]|uniref:Uncharacterized protein n=1 Tax=Halteria grandinella TaxID=5974 RepID=A0A8J8NJG3_HALGN|nr:hypothetical protein FGO68_gene14565 [Halteria grandinella]